ncbi:MAG: ABC transporter ATP-binding protein [Actinomycetota bacterium]|nr:ABC transporter ATP-binding protein [Actinomycetota bacterium]
MTVPAITVDRVSKRFRLYHERNQTLKSALLQRKRATYEEFWALRGVGFEVPEGTTLGLIGENGSGKSTLLKCMARILRPDDGHIDIRGKVSALLELGAGFHPELSGRENVYLNASILGLSRKEVDRKVDAIVDFAGLARFIDTPVKNYSSGMYVRLGFSVAVSVEPDVLLVDEVLAVGDEQFQGRCRDKFAELKAQGRTIVVVSHALGTVRNLCDTAAWLQGGRLHELGPAGAVIDRYIDDVHHAEQEEAPAVARSGSGEGRVERVELLDAALRATETVRTGDAVTFRMHFRATDPIEAPVFGMAVHTAEGVEVTAATSRDEATLPPRLEGSGYVDLEVAGLVLLPGTYDVTAWISDRGGEHTYDFRHHAFRFVVDAGPGDGSYAGIITLGGRWASHHSVLPS